ncbi:aldolase [Piedraia hortae CBS 480.64]|uniref:Fructose-bisphosphate aldolase n=1 Tax=Piedraia hortae CBS 480.64 TaxID=1314780 RepID=A0A6A7BY61_9PEZI|nr:aldolase [Piedraia hortae CBS 480.64]
MDQNRAIRMLRASSEGKYGILGVVSYNVETILGAIAAAESKKSPIQILLFPWAFQKFRILVDVAAQAARRASVPVTVHMDHAQDPDVVRAAAAYDAADGTPAFDSIMVDMSHYDKEENLARTRELVAVCRARGIATEAEPGRIEGGEDGVQSIDSAVMTTAEEVDDFVGTGIDFLAPSFGNVHGNYGGKIQLDFERLRTIRDKANGRVQLVLHGTNEFTPEIMDECVQNGMTRVNVNGLVLDKYYEFIRESAGRVPMTQLMEKGVSLIKESCEEWINHLGCSGKGSK